MKKYFFACPLRGSVISLVYIMPASSMFQCIMQPTRKVYVNSFWSLNLTSCMHIKLTSLIFFRSRPNTDRPTGVICYAASVRNRLCSLHVLSKHQIVVVETWKSTCIEYANSNNNSTLKVRNWKLAEFLVLRSKSHRKPQKILIINDPQKYLQLPQLNAISDDWSRCNSLLLTKFLSSTLAALNFSAYTRTVIRLRGYVMQTWHHPYFTVPRMVTTHEWVRGGRAINTYSLQATNRLMATANNSYKYRRLHGNVWHSRLSLSSLPSTDRHRIRNFLKLK